MDSFVGKISTLNSYTASREATESTVREAKENFIIRGCQPFNVVESVHFLALLRVCLNCSKKNIFIPKADATKEGIRKRIASFKNDLAVTLKNSGASKFHHVLDAWTSSNCFNFLAITCHYIDDN
jgi:hypothetical protein